MKTLREVSNMAAFTLSNGNAVVGYVTMTISKRDGLISGEGTMTCPLEMGRDAIKSSQPVDLTFAGGINAKVIVTRADANRLAFVTTGPITGIDLADLIEEG